MNIKLNGVATLHHLGVIRVEGEEAAKFLHGQLTQDFSLLGRGEARLAAFCSSKGRMQASFYGFKRSDTEILLICSLDILETVLKRMSMFVMRAKAKLTNATVDFKIRGLAGSAAELIAPATSSVWSKIDIGNASIVQLYPADGVQRALWVAPLTEAVPVGEVLSEQDWRWGEVRSGIAMITQPIVDAFVPQMLNYESVGGVNFKKGCYPGQEVVARSQFRGTLKRRAYLVHSESPMNVGDEVFQATVDDQPCGIVAQIAASPLGGFDAILSGQVSAIELGSLHLACVQGPGISVLPLPYSLLADI